MNKYSSARLFAQDLKHWLATEPEESPTSRWAEWDDEDRIIGFAATQ